MSGHGNSSLMSFMNNGTNKFYIDNTNVNSGSFIGIGNYISSLNALVVFAGCKTAEGRSNMKLFLNGGGSGESFMEPFKILNQEIDNNKPVLYVPLAMDENEHPYDGCYEWITEKFKNINIPYIDMTRSFEDLASRNFENYSCIFIGGGNTYKLLKGMKETKTFNKLAEYVNNGGIIFGASAGAVIFGKDINIISEMDKNDVNLIDTKGFDMINRYSIFPHYTNKKSKLSKEENTQRHEKFTKSIIEFSKSLGKVYALPEEDTMIYCDGNLEIIGTLPYYICENGIITKYDVVSRKALIK